MYKLGLFVGKFMPPHMGHKMAILEASKLCQKLIVLVCFEPKISELESKKNNLPIMTLAQKLEWLKKEFCTYKNIEIKGLDESGIPLYPTGWVGWSQAVKNTINNDIDVIFGSELSYKQGYQKYFPNSIYYLQDVDRTKINISSTMIRNNLEKNINYIIPSAQKFFRDILSKNKNHYTK